MSRPSDPQAAALLDHIFSQTQANINFLASQNYITGADASELISRLNTSQSRARESDAGLANSIQALTIAPTHAPVASPGPAPGPRNVPQPPQPRSNQARAVWGYNEDGREPNDLSFASGEIIEVIDENNSDWWTGRCRGRQGLFPSNHVEKIGSAAPTPMTSPPPAPFPVQMPMNPMGPPSGPPAPYGAPPPASPVGYSNEKPVYRPFGASYQGTDQPPPNGVVVTNSVGLQQAPGQEQKKHKFGRLGSTVANSAAGGLGFGAGAAVGSGIINAIF